MSVSRAILAGLIQGLTEFLPVSSSGHLVIFASLFGDGQSGNLMFTVFLHLATLLAVVWTYRADVWSMARALFSVCKDSLTGKVDFSSPDRKLTLMVIIGTIPAVAAAILIKLLRLEEALENIFVVACMLLVTAVFMFLADRLSDGAYAITDARVAGEARIAETRPIEAPFADNPISDAPIADAFITNANSENKFLPGSLLKASVVVGIFQALAILPGLSRSGSVIFAGLLSGLKKDLAVKYAFILSIPVILGSAILELPKALNTGAMDMSAISMAAGFTAALLCGLVSIRLIKALIKMEKFFVFGVYCAALSAFAFLVSFGLVHF